MLSTNIFRIMEICSKKKIMNTINEELDLNEPDDEPDNDKSNESDEN